MVLKNKYTLPNKWSQPIQLINVLFLKIQKSTIITHGNDFQCVYLRESPNLSFPSSILLWWTMRKCYRKVSWENLSSKKASWIEKVWEPLWFTVHWISEKSFVHGEVGFTFEYHFRDHNCVLMRFCLEGGWVCVQSEVDGVFKISQRGEW